MPQESARMRSLGMAEPGPAASRSTARKGTYFASGCAADDSCARARRGGPTTASTTSSATSWAGDVGPGRRAAPRDSKALVLYEPGLRPVHEDRRFPHAAIRVASNERNTGVRSPPQFQFSSAKSAIAQCPCAGLSSAERNPLLAHRVSKRAIASRKGEVMAHRMKKLLHASVGAVGTLALSRPQAIRKPTRRLWFESGIAVPAPDAHSTIDIAPARPWSTGETPRGSSRVQGQTRSRKGGAPALALCSAQRDVLVAETNRPPQGRASRGLRGCDHAAREKTRARRSQSKPHHAPS